MAFHRGSRMAGLLACFVVLSAHHLALAEVLTPSSAAAQQFPTGAPAAAGEATSPSPAAAPSPAIVTPSPVVVQPTPAAAQPPAEPQPAASGSATINLQPFNTVVSCVPFNILVSAGVADNAYSATTAYAPEVDAAVVLKVEDQTLYVGFNKSYETTEAIKVNISMPAAQLQGVVNNGVGDIILNPGFNTDYTIVTNKGTGKILLRGITTNKLRIYSQGTGDIFAKGEIKLANITSQATGSVTVSGVDKVVGDLQGITNLFVDPTSDAAPIDVSAQGISKVYYTQGQCTSGSQMNIDVPFFSMDLGLSGCRQVKPSAFPRYKAYWTCGTRVRGSSICTASAKAAQAAAAQNGDVSVSSSSTNGNGFASASASGDGEPVRVESTGGRPQNAPPADTAAAQEAAAAGDIGISVAGRRLHRHKADHKRKLHKFVFPEIDFPDFPQINFPDLPTVSVSSSSSSSDGDDNGGVTVTSTGDGSSASSSSSGTGGRVAVASIECVVPVEQLYIAAA